MKKCCKKCGVEKDFSEFTKDPRMKDGCVHKCKQCRSEELKHRYRTDPVYRARMFEIKEAWYAENYVKRYGITNQQFDEMFEKQGRCCKLCKATEHGRGKSYKNSRWNIDHDHKTGKVRGILCHHCNVSLGHFERLCKEIGKSEILKYLK